MRRCVKWFLRRHRHANRLQALKTLRKRMEGNDGLETSSLSILIDTFRSHSLKPGPHAYSFTIEYLLQRNWFLHLPLILDHLETAETFEVPERTFVGVIQSYGKAGMLQDAIGIFRRIPNFRCKPTAFSLDALLSLLCKNEKGVNLVPAILIKTTSMGIRLEPSSLIVLIEALCLYGMVRYALELLKSTQTHHDYMVDKKMYSLVLSSICKHHGLKAVDILDFVEEMRQLEFLPNELEYKEVIDALIAQGRVDDAYSVVIQMRIEGKRAGLLSYTRILAGFVSVNDFDKADKIFDEMLLLGLIPDVLTYNTYIESLCKQHNFQQVCRMIICMEKAGCKPNLETYNTVMDGYSNAGFSDKVREVISEIAEKGFHWNSCTYRIFVDALLTKGKVQEACHMFGEMLKKGFIPRPSTSRALIQGLCQQNLLYESSQILEEMVSLSICPDAGLWEALLVGFKLTTPEISSAFDDEDYTGLILFCA